MRKQELIKNIAATSGQGQEAVKSVLSALTAEIAESLKAGEPVNITGLGKFYTTRFKSRTQKDPQGREVTIPEHEAPRFKYSPTLRQNITSTR